MPPSRSSIALAGALPLVGCQEPTTAALLGLWVNEDAGTVRALEFVTNGDALARPEVATLPDAYLIRMYAVGSEPVDVQAGTYAVQDDLAVVIDGETRITDDVLVWTVWWDSSGAAGTLGDPILQLSDERLVLRSETAEGGRREYTAADALP